jgi:hypothetical protein
MTDAPTRRSQSSRRTKAAAAALFATLALVGAFLVSAIAGIQTGGAELEGAPTAAALGAAGDERPAASPLRVEILNGAGRAGLARVATAQLRADGYDVVFFGNAARFDHPRSFVLDRVGDLAGAAGVARALGIDSVASEPDASLLLDVSVVLGADWPPPPPETPTPVDRFRHLFAPGADPESP